MIYRGYSIIRRKDGTFAISLGDTVLSEAGTENDALDFVDDIERRRQFEDAISATR